MAQHYVYRFYAELKDYEPKIWRRFEINGERTMAELGYALMLMFEMQASHLFSFRENTKENLITLFRERNLPEEADRLSGHDDENDVLNYTRFELVDEETVTMGDERLMEADRITLSQLTRSPGWRVVFEYDFGDSWEVDVVIEECEKQEFSLALLPRVLEGEGYGIIEDVGGPGGLEEFAEAMKKGKGKAYEEFRGWLGIDHLDMEAFDRDDMNFRLKKLIRVYRDMYEYHLEPTEQSYKLLYREYKKPKGSAGTGSASRGWAPPPKA